MWEFVLGLDGLPTLATVPILGFIFQWISIAISGLALVWNWDWASVDDSSIVPEAKPQTPKDVASDDGNALIG